MSANSSRPSTPSHQQADHHLAHPAHRLLTLAHPTDPETTTKIFTDKILHKPLLLNTSAASEGTDNRTLRRHIRLRKNSYALKHARPKPLSAREKRSLGLYDLRPEECRYEIYRELNVSWRRYILEVLGYVDREGKVVKGRIGAGVAASNGAGLLASADFHGMEVEVVRCADVGRVGCKGIVVRETRSTVTVVCDEKEDLRKDRRKKGWRGKVGGGGEGEDVRVNMEELDKVRMIMKKGTVFRVKISLPTKDEIVVDDDGKENSNEADVKMKDDATTVQKEDEKPRRQLIFELHGDQLEIRPIERAVKKFKWKAMDYL